MDLSDKDTNGNSEPPLVKAILEKDGRSVKLLLEEGHDVSNKSYAKHYGPLHFATQVASYDIVRILIEAGADVNSLDDDLNSPLHVLIKYNGLQRFENFWTAKILIDNGCDVNAIDSSGKSALCLAVERQSIEIAKLLIESGADLNIIDAGGMSALSHAVEGVDYTLTELLVDSGASTDILHSGTIDPFSIAFRNIDHSLVQLLLSIEPRLKLNDKHECFEIAACHGWMDVLDKIIKFYDIDVAFKRPDGSGVITTVIESHHLTGEEKLKLSSFLSSMGAASNLTHTEMYDILTLIMDYADKDTVSLFAKIGMSPSQPSLNDYPNLLHRAANEVDKSRLFKLVWEKGKFDTNVLSYGLVDEIVRAKNSSALKYLLKLDADVVFNAARKDLLQMAIEHGNISIVELSLSYGADVNSVSSRGQHFRGHILRRGCKVFITPLSRTMTLRGSDFALCIVRHIVLMELEEKSVSQRNYDTIISSPELLKIYRTCKAEIEMMQKTWIRDAVSFLDVLVNPEYFVRDEMVISALADEDTLKEFAAFSAILRERFERTRKRPMLIDEAEPVLMRLFKCDPRKSYSLIAYNVAKYLKNRDLRNLVLVFQTSEEIR